MKNFTWKKAGLMGLLLTTTLGAQAIEQPALPTQTLTAGQKYVLFNKANLNGYMARTGWDGALYFLGLTDSNYKNHQLEAVDNGDGTWAFVQRTEATEEGAEETVSYMLLPNGSANINMANTMALWEVEAGDYEGYYKLKAGEGNNENVVGMHMHLNNGNQYWVISYYGGPWYPDFPCKTDENGVNITDENGHYIMADSTSLNWAFVLADDVATYAVRNESYNLIVNYEETYLGVVGYEDGFKNGADAIEAIYNNPEYVSEWKDSINAIINAKVALYTEIEKAYELNEDNNATLAAAIETAYNVFTANAVATELDAAKVALVKAESDYSMGFGDYTSLGQNMSFEDLSAQGGNTTTGVGNPPAGWMLIVGGDTCTTADEIKAHGITAWCGVNADCTGETKDGSMGFGIWTSGFPTVQLSQTIGGLENGTYEVSAALMVGANGNGSRRTTQRIFGNLNAIYFGSEAEYNQSLLDATEVYSFAGLEEPVTDTEMQEMTVRAYVYDGTLTFGLRTDGNVRAANRDAANSAGGDGWFKVDNFRITKVGYDIDEALNVFKHFYNILDDYYYNAPMMAQETYSKLEVGVDELDGIDANSTAEEVDAAIVKAAALLTEVEPEIAVYAQLDEAIQEAYENYELYAHMPGAAVYEEVITTVEKNWEDGVYTVAEVPAVIAQLEEALEACKKSKIEVGDDITHLLINPSFENQAATQPGGDTGGVADAPKGWTLIINGDTCRTAAEISAHNVTTWCAINSGDVIDVDVDGVIITKQPTDGDKLWGIWTSYVPEVQLSQTLTGLPAGTYTLGADVMVQNNWAGDNITTQRIFGNQFVQMFSSYSNHGINMPEDALWGLAADEAIYNEEYEFTTFANYTCAKDDPMTSLLRSMSVKFVVDETGVATIGFRTNGVNSDGVSYDGASVGRDGQGWFKVDNFTLTYDSEVVPEKLAQGIEENVAEGEVVARYYYTLNGTQVAAPVQGVNIVKCVMADGSVKVSKVLVVK